MEKCVFCNQKEIAEDIVHETENFWVKVGFGLVTPGHVMVIPKKHFDCFAQLSDDLWKEYNSLKDFLKKKIKERFSEPFLIEYGNTGSISHAHTHFIPLKGEGYEIKSIMKEMVLGGEVDYEEADFYKLKEIYFQEKKYILIEEKEKTYVCHIKSGVREKTIDVYLGFRIFFTQKKGLTGVLDWQKLSIKEKIEDEEKRKNSKKILTKLLKDSNIS